MRSDNSDEFLRNLSIVHHAGAEKMQDTISRLRNFNIFAHENTVIGNINNEVKCIARAVMRNPDLSTLKNLYIIHQSIKDIFADQPDKVLNFILSSGQESRGGFKDAEQLKKFLNTDPKKIEPSRLMTGIETFASSLAYCSFDAAKKAEYADPTIRHFVDTILYPIIQEKNVPYISRTYINRGVDDIGKSTSNEKKLLKSKNQAVTIDRIDVSEASGEDVEPFPKKKTASREFLTQSDLQTNTFIGAALQSHIPVRGNTSGSAASTLSAIKGILDFNNVNSNPIMGDSESCQKLAGALLIGPYLRGDFHSIAETYIGVMFYISANIDKIPLSQIEQIQPRQGFEGALKCLISAASNEGKYGSRKISLRHAIETVAPEILSKIGDEKAETRVYKKPS